ncbi:MAG: ACP S-malonyltransferase, partial [Actinomycetota bacterium]
MTIALFPGQGVQSPDMGRGLTDASPDVFAAASDVLEVDVAELCTSGRSGEADLGTTRWAQPAVLVCGVAAFEILSRGGESFGAAAGHSVGEYAALVGAGAVSLTDALRIISVRAEATDEAGRSTPGAMAAVMRVDREVVDRICAREGVALAAENGPGQFVVSGPVAGLKRAIEALAAAGAVSRHLDVSAAFHSPV